MIAIAPLTKIYMSQQGSRFSNRPSSPIPQQPQQPPSSPLPPTGRLPQIPLKYVPQNLTIHIDSSGRKAFINPQGQQSMIYPMANKFFGDFYRQTPDAAGQHNRATSINSVKREMENNYSIPPQSKIFNYATREIHLLGQLYQGLIPQQQKQEVIKQYNRLKGRNLAIKRSLLLYGIFLVATRRMMWSKLTANRGTQFGLFLFGGTLWAKTFIDLGAFQITSIVEHEKSYEKLLRAYEDDYKIVY